MENPNPTQWWKEACDLEMNGQIREAEEAIRNGCQHMAYAMATADLYRRRMLRLKSEGDVAGAEEAFQNASRWSASYASMATSGGEGAALSLQRDKFQARLTREFRL
ncbi:MAG TPA: hypothetical protein VEH04_08790 [Verrucomicrobiae bacterium]|nr:hypothetical protein [Verrucomicrobiae bacterium]